MKNRFLIYLMAFLFVAVSCSDDSKETEEDIQKETIKTKLYGTWVPYSYKLEESGQHFVFQKCNVEIAGSKEYHEEYLSRTYRYDDDGKTTWFYHCDQTPEAVITEWDVVEIDEVKDVLTSGGKSSEDGGPMIFRIVTVDQDKIVLDTKAANIDAKYYIEIELRREQ